MKPAILIVDLTNDFFKLKNLKKKKKELILATNELVCFARSKGIMVVWIRQEVMPNLSNAPKLQKQNKLQVNIAGTKGAQLLSGLKTNPNDWEVTKTRFSAFFKTNLEAILNKHAIDTIVIGGVTTHACVHMTAVDAYQRDLEVVIAKECIASNNEDYHNVFLRYQTDQKMLGYSNKQIKEYLMKHYVE